MTSKAFTGYNRLTDVPTVTLISSGANVQELREALVEAACILENREIPMPVARAHAEAIRALLAKPEVITNG